MRAVKIVIFLIVAVLFFYLITPSSDFPDPPPGALRSDEPGDNETPLRRAYFTDLTRREVIEHYKKELSFLPVLRLNYPPEDAQTLIRDQTRSTYLEELLHPFRESLFVNGFEPKEDKDAIFIKGEYYDQKVTVRYIQSNVLVRVLVYGLILILLLVLFNEYTLDFTKFYVRKRTR